MRTRALLLLLCLAVASLALTACDPRPQATVYLTGDSNWPANELVGATHLREQPYLTIVDVWPGLGVRRDEAPYGDGFASQRLASVRAATHLDYVVTDLGANDGPFDPAVTEAALRRFLDAAGGIPVIWIAPAAVGGDAANLAELERRLGVLQGEYDNLWVISLDAVLARIGGCPTLAAGGLAIGPTSACFVDTSQDVHLSDPGRLVLAALVRVALDAATSGRWRADLGTDIDAIKAALLPAAAG